MSETHADDKPAPRPQRGGGPFGGMNLPAEKSMNFTASGKRLLGKLRPERLWLALVLALAVISVTFSVLGPRLLGEGTNLIFSGVVSKSLPMGSSQAEVIAGLNLPMLIKLASVRVREPLEVCVSAAQEAGRKYISVASYVMAGEA